MFKLFNKKPNPTLKIVALNEKVKHLERLLEEQKVIHDDEVQHRAEEILGLPYDFGNALKDGSVEHPLNELGEEEREVAIGSLENIYQNKHFQKILRYLIDLYGNVAIRNSELTDAGRFSINGVTKVMRELESAHSEFVERHKPQEEYDKHEIISSVMKN